MGAATLTTADYLAALQSLLPRGRVWPREAASVQSKLMAGLAETPARLHARANNLLIDSFPATAYELLPEWEATLGLPDPCAGTSPTLQARRGQVVARLVARGGQSVPYFTASAANLGFTVTIQEYAPARAGMLRVGTPLNGADWAHAWQINAPAVTVTDFRAGLSVAGEPLRTWGNTVLECELRRSAPAHTVLLFAYAGELPVTDPLLTDDGDRILDDSGAPLLS